MVVPADQSCRISTSQSNIEYLRGVPGRFQYWWCSKSQRPWNRPKTHWNERLQVKMCVYTVWHTVTHHSFHREMLFSCCCCIWPFLFNVIFPLCCFFLFCFPFFSFGRGGEVARAESGYRGTGRWVRLGYMTWIQKKSL